MATSRRELAVTNEKDFKRLIRKRMERTGENYTTARGNLIDPGSPADAEGSTTPGQIVFPIRQSRLFAAINRRVARATSDGDPSAFVSVGGDTVEVRMGTTFTATIPRSSIVSVGPYAGRVKGWGVHGGDGVWLVNGSSRGIVAIHLNPPAQAKMRSGPLSGEVELRELRVSVDRPDELIAKFR